MLGPILIAGILSCAWALRMPGVEPEPEDPQATQAEGMTTIIKTGDFEELVGYGFYRYHDYGASWHMAQEICQEEGSHLMVISNELEAELVRVFFDRYPKTRGDARSSGWAWVGLSERGTNNQYFSVLGDPLDKTGFYEWYPGYPELPGPNNCVVAERETGLLADDYCERHYSFFCESNLHGPSSVL